MGLLSRLPFGWGMMGQQDPSQQPWVGFPASTPPFAPEMGQAPQGNGAGPPITMPQQQAPSRAQGWSDRLNTAIQSPLFNMGVNLLAASENGGDWGRFATGMQQYGQQHMQRQQMQNEERRAAAAEGREQTAFGRQQQMWGHEDQQRAAWERAVGLEQDPQRQATLRAMGPAGYGEWMAGEQQRRFQAEQAELDRRTTMAAASVRANDDSIGRYFQRMDAERIGAENETAARIQSVGLPSLQNLRMSIEQAGAAMLTGQPVDARSRVTLGRLFNGSGPERANLEVWRAQVLGPALETMRGLGAMTEREFIAAQEAFANPDMTYESAMRLLNQRIQEAERRIATAQVTTQYFRENNNALTGVTNAQGEDYSAYLARNLQERGLMPSGDWNSNRPDAPGTGGAATQQQQQGPQRGQVVDGYRFMGGDPANRRNWVRVNDPSRRDSQGNYLLR